MKTDRELTLAASLAGGRRPVGGIRDFDSYGSKLLADPIVVMRLVRVRPGEILFASAELRADKEIGMAVVRLDGIQLRHLDESLRDDEEVVLAACRSSGLNGLFWASDRLNKDEAFVAMALALSARLKKSQTE